SRRCEPQAHEMWRHSPDVANDPCGAREWNAGHARIDGRIEPCSLRCGAARSARGPSRSRRSLVARGGSVRRRSRGEGSHHALGSPGPRRRAGDEGHVSRKLIAYLVVVDAIALLLLGLNLPHELRTFWPHYVGWTVISLLSELLWLKTLSGEATAS